MAAIFGLYHLAIRREREGAQRNTVRMHYRQLRDASDHFSLPEDHFRKIYRLNKENAQYVLDALEAHIRETARCTGVPVIVKVFATFQLLASGSCQRHTGLSYSLGLSQSALSQALNVCLDAITTHLAPQWVKFPTVDDYVHVKQRFFEKYNFPGCIGIIDGTHIAIVSPPHDHPTVPQIAYYNRKGYYSINALIVCDADLTILFVNARYPGSTHDSAVWQLSGLKKHLQQLYLRNSEGWFIGDSGYPVQPWLLTPVVRANTNAERAYNTAHKKARNTIKRCIGVLKNRFRCLLKHRVLHYNPTTAGKIVYSCAVLHNLCVKRNDPWDEDIIDNIDEVIDFGINNDQPDGRDFRNNVIRNHFR